MRQGASTRETSVLLTDSDIAFIVRGLEKDDTNDDDNGVVFEEFYELLGELDITQLDCSDE